MAISKAFSSVQEGIIPMASSIINVDSDFRTRTLEGPKIFGAHESLGPTQKLAFFGSKLIGFIK